MKQLTLELKKRLLIVECESGNYAHDIQHDENGPKPIKLICKGSELTEEIARDLVNPLWDYYKNYLESDSSDVGNYKRLIKQTALESFISAIEAQGYYWGENLIEKPTMEKYGWYSANSQEEESGWMYEEGEEKYYEALKEYEEAESRIFNPEKTLIFETL